MVGQLLGNGLVQPLPKALVEELQLDGGEGLVAQGLKLGAVAAAIGEPAGDASRRDFEFQGFVPDLAGHGPPAGAQPATGDPLVGFAGFQPSPFLVCKLPEQIDQVGLEACIGPRTGGSVAP